MPKRIDKLTKAQIAAMPACRDKWIEIGLRTGNADFATFDKFMPICYEKAGLKYPKNVVRVQSPLVGALAAAVAEGIWKKKRGAVGGAVGGAVDDAVDDAVQMVIDIAKKTGVTLSWHDWLGGQFWVGGWYWWGCAFTDFFFSFCKLKLLKDIMERAEAYRKICESVNYIWPNREFIIVCDRPKAINRDADGRLHNSDGKSIEYKDGFGLYHIHGVKFTEEQHTKAKTATVQELLSWADIEQRSALLRDRKLEEMLKKAKAVIIDETDECGGYKLWEIDLGLRQKAKAMTYGGWSDKRPYAKWVPNNSVKCLDTVAALRGLTTDEFKSAIKS